MNTVIGDLRYAARELRRRPGFAITAVLSLALGIGATSAVFSVVYGVLINPFPYVGADRMMQLALRDTAGRFRYPGMSGVQLDQLRQARTVESVVGEDGWNLTTTDGDIPEDVVASYITPNAPNHWGTPAMLGRWLIPADAPPGQDPARVVVLGYQFWQRYYAGDPSVVGRTIQLVRKDYQIVGVMPPRFRWREADIYVPLKVRAEPNIYYGASLKIRAGRVHRGSQRGAAADPPAVRRRDAGALSRSVPRQPAQHHRDVCPADGAAALPAARRGGVAAARRLRQRLDPAAGPRRAPPAGARRPRRARRGARPHRAAAPDRGDGDRLCRRGARRADRVAGPGADRRLGADQFVRRRIGDRDERAGAAVQHGAGDRDRAPLRCLAGAAAVAPGSRPRRPGQHAPGHRQRARPAHPSRDDRRPGRADAADADRGRRGREGIPEARECGSRLQPAEHDVAADPGPRRHLPDVEGAFRVLRAAPRGRGGDAAGRVRGDFDQRDAARQRRRHRDRDSRQRSAREAGGPRQLRQS